MVINVEKVRYTHVSLSKFHYGGLASGLCKPILCYTIMLVYIRLCYEMSLHMHGSMEDVHGVIAHVFLTQVMKIRCKHNPF